MTKIIITILAILMIPFGLHAESSRFALGVGYPAVLIKYQPVELRYSMADGIRVAAARGYKDFYNKGRIKGFIGLEAGYVWFNTLDVNGNGYEIGPFIGGECRVAENIGLSIDLVPTYINIRSDDSIRAKGFEIVTNIGIYYYFGKMKGK